MHGGEFVNSKLTSVDTTNHRFSAGSVKGLIDFATACVTLTYGYKETHQHQAQAQG
jgi:hypothetical protein